MKAASKTQSTVEPRAGAALGLLLPVWVVVIACFFYQLVRAGLPVP